MESNNFDELLYSLPDYISGELHDEHVKKQIEEKLLSDSSFRKEYDSLKAAMNFIQETELEPPSEVYFANLQANILSKVHKNESRSEQNFFARLLGWWKIVVPALTVCVVIVIYTRNMNTPELPLKEDKISQINSEKNVVSNQDTSAKDSNTNESVSPADNTSKDNTDESISKQKRTDTFTPVKTITADTETNSVNDDTDATYIFGRDDDSQVQDEYDNLSPDDQQDILESLKAQNFN
ncbi:MAG: hypothetical protein K1X86_07650 [Ignavibacteria bacterium]|nr:hypothetical protein [Ignavibacteria bacterium]